MHIFPKHFFQFQQKPRDKHPGIVRIPPSIFLGYLAFIENLW